MPSLLLQSCRLTYFGIAGRGEATRLGLAIAGVEFEDERIAFGDWKNLKPDTPWGSLPVLTLKDGRQVAQQRAILRFVGKEVGLYPTDDSFSAAKVDEIIDAAEDIGSKINAVGRGAESQEAKEAARKAACEAGGVTYGILESIDNFIADNGAGGHCVGDSMTVADLFVYTATSNLVGGLYDGVPTTTVDGFANIMACRKLVRSHPSVKKWYDELDAPIWPSYGPLE